MPTVTRGKKTRKLSPATYGAVKEARDRKKTMASQAVVIFQKHITEKRDMSSEEKENFDKCTKDVAELSDRISALEDMDGSDEDEDEGGDDGKGKRDDTDDDEDTDKNKDKEKDDNDRSGKNPGEERNRQDDKSGTGRNADSRNNPTRRNNGQRTMELRRYNGETKEHFADRQRRSTQAYVDMVCDYLQYGNAGMMQHAHTRALQADIDIAGGYLILPEQVSQKILKKVDNMLWLLQFATVATLANAQSLGIPTLESNIDDGDWTTEIAQINADTGMTMGKRALTPTPIRKRILVSERWLRLAFNAAFQSADDANGQGGSPENIVINRLAYTIKNTWEKNFFLGNGSGKPLGLFTASSRGISTARDSLTGSATTFTYAGLLAAKWALKIQYHASARWAFSRLAMQNIMGLVDSNGRPLLNISTLPNTPDQLLQFPTMVSEHVPNTFTTGLYVGMLGAYEFYNAAISQEITVKKAEELYAETGQIGFFVSAEADAMPALEEAFVRLKTN